MMKWRRERLEKGSRERIEIEKRQKRRHKRELRRLLEEED